MVSGDDAPDEHLEWMRQAMEMVCGYNLAVTSVLIYLQAEEALAASEVPVGCVFVRDGMIIARARNRTNELRNVLSLMSLTIQYTDHLAAI